MLANPSSQKLLLINPLKIQGKEFWDFTPLVLLIIFGSGSDFLGFCRSQPRFKMSDILGGDPSLMLGNSGNIFLLFIFLTGAFLISP